MERQRCCGLYNQAVPAVQVDWRQHLQAHPAPCRHSPPDDPRVSRPLAVLGPSVDGRHSPARLALQRLPGPSHRAMLALLAHQQHNVLRQVLPAAAQAALWQQERGMKLFKARPQCARAREPWAARGVGVVIARRRRRRRLPPAAPCSLQPPCPPALLTADLQQGGAGQAQGAAQGAGGGVATPLG